MFWSATLVDTERAEVGFYVQYSALFHHVLLIQLREESSMYKKLIQLLKRPVNLTNFHRSYTTSADMDCILVVVCQKRACAYFITRFHSIHVLRYWSHYHKLRRRVRGALQIPARTRF